MKKDAKNIGNATIQDQLICVCVAKSNEIVVCAFYGSEKANTLLLHTLWKDSLFISLDIHYQIMDQFRIDLTAQM